MPGIPRAGRVVAGWRLLRRIGQGSLSRVYLAEPAAGGPAVALKLVDLAGPDAGAAAAAFQANAETTRALVHPAIVAVHAAGIDGTLAWLAMEPVPGVALGRYTTPARRLPEPLVLRAGEAVAQALGHAHRLGVVHRDVKPANILVHWPDDIVKLADFGLARFSGAMQTRTGLLVGSPAYMAPEQLSGQAPTPAGDFYALGVTLFQLLTGHLPHEADRLGDLLRSVAGRPAPDLRTLDPAAPAALAELLARLLDRRPAVRPQDGEALAAQLRGLRQSWPAARGVKSHRSAPGTR